MNLARRLEHHGYALAASLALLAVAAAALPTEVGARAGSEPEAILGAIAAAVVAVSIVPFAVLIRATATDARLLVAATASAGAAAIHFAVISEHFEEYWLFGLFFVASGVAQLVWATAVVLWPNRALVAIGTLGNAAIVALWVTSRTVGLPVGPEAGSAEAVGVADVAASGFEAIVVTTTIWYLARPGDRRRAATSVTFAVAILTAVIVAFALSESSAAHDRDSGSQHRSHHQP